MQPLCYSKFLMGQNCMPYPCINLTGATPCDKNSNKLFTEFKTKLCYKVRFNLSGVKL